MNSLLGTYGDMVPESTLVFPYHIYLICETIFYNFFDCGWTAKINFYSHCFHNMLLLLVLRHTDSAVCVWESGLSSQKMSLRVTYWAMHLRGVIYVVTYVDISKLSLTFAWRR